MKSTMTKRLFDLVFTIPGIMLLSPLLFICAIWVKIDSQGGIFFRQVRIGKNGVPFRIFKFRTMVVDAEKHGRQITVGNDSRITRSGKFLRHYKLDELPQLFNVLLGDMSLVGPRPEVPRYIAEYSSEDREIVLSVRPGITDNASIEFCSENELLEKSLNPERTYIEEVLPIKIAYYKDYVQSNSLWGDLIIVLKTFRAIV